MIQRLEAAPAVIRATSLGNSIRVEPLTRTIGAELSNVNLGAAAEEDDLLMAEIRALLLKHRVVFFRDQDITRAARGLCAPFRRAGGPSNARQRSRLPRTGSDLQDPVDKSPGSSQLLNYLTSQANIPEHQVRFRWRKNSVAFWDNRSTQHYAVMDYPPCHRKMERTAIIGDSPY
ncbi:MULTISPECIES: TauD/TfdA dioxygenase family protein [Cupriavidus]|uniref:TauD/TfdA dioxygenase family protein n=1 Tax=Cupriavidus necator TaxID=106590 RepID=UPI0026A23277